jgi:RNA 3'-terminal phosphate cyclase (ATP)
MLEGGGQILRTSIALAALLGKEIEIDNIRGKRSPPGLKAQHITGVKAVATVSGAIVKGLTIGSTSLQFTPSKRTGGDFRFDIGTAGSISLVLQALMPAVAFSQESSQITVIGGTDVRWSPTIDYMRLVILPILRKMGYMATIDVERRGHYPKGGGLINFKNTSVDSLKSLVLMDRGTIIYVGGRSHCINLPCHVAERQVSAASQVLNKNYLGDVQIDVECNPHKTDPRHSPGSGISLSAVTSSDTRIGADAIGEKGKPAEKVGKEAADQLVEDLKSGMALDRHMADIIIPYLAVAKGLSTVTVSRLTLHTLTNIKVTEILTDVSFNIEGELGFPAIISVEGIGFTRST